MCNVGSKSSALKGHGFPSQLDGSILNHSHFMPAKVIAFFIANFLLSFPKRSTKGGRLLQRKAFIFNNEPRSVEKVELDRELAPAKWRKEDITVQEKKKFLQKKKKKKKYKSIHFIFLRSLRVSTLLAYSSVY
jgi:hypothetical protein